MIKIEVGMSLLFATDCLHWRRSHNAFMHVRNKNGNIQGRSLNVPVKVIFPTIRNCS